MVERGYANVEALAKKAGVHHGTVYRYLRGAQTQTSTLRKIAKVLRVDVGELI
jgi:predicted transcriptional regulator